MGISKFLQISDEKISFEETGFYISRAELSEKTILFDGFIIYCKGKAKVKLSHEGANTGFLKMTYDLLLMCRELKIDAIWLFDGPIKHKKVNRTGKIEFKKSELDEMKQLINSFGYIVIQCQKEAEYYGVELMKKKPEIYGIYTTDTDVLIRGGTMIIKKKIQGREKYLVVSSKAIQKQFNLSLEDLAKIGVMMGCDYIKKIKGVGPKTILYKFKDYILPEEHQEVLKILLAPVVDEIKILEGEYDEKKIIEILSARGFTKFSKIN